MYTGVIEGFYGLAWELDARLAFIDFMAAQGIDEYIYAPKSDAGLRRHWMQAYPQQEFEALQALATHCKNRGVRFGLGLSPLNAVLEAHPGNVLSAEKCAQINALQLDSLSFLFDDMHNVCDGLAQQQLRVVDELALRLNADTFMVCPSYYSFDPVLERVFGARPANYWEDLGRGLDASIGMYWTGNAVCSASISAKDIAAIAELYQRKPVLWDNYPVNDGEKASQRLNLDALDQREQALSNALAAHYCNPMNECYLSRLAVHSLPRLYASGANNYAAASATREALGQVDAPTRDLLQRDWQRFTQEGLQCIAPEQQAHLAREYRQLGSPFAAEVADWLGGVYAFDPACLTEDQAV